MGFAPGQFITAQRLNRLQPTTYWSLISGAVTGPTSGADIAGTSMNITTETDGATAALSWGGTFYAGGAVAFSSLQAVWDVNNSPTFAVFLSSASTRLSSYANWVTTVPVAGTYTFKLRGSVAAGGSLQVYTSLKVQITEVA